MPEGNAKLHVRVATPAMAAGLHLLGKSITSYKGRVPHRLLCVRFRPVGRQLQRPQTAVPLEYAGRPVARSCAGKLDASADLHQVFSIRTVDGAQHLEDRSCLFAIAAAVTAHKHVQGNPA